MASLDRAVIANIHLVIVSDAYEARHQMDNNQGHDYHHVQWLVTHAYPPKIDHRGDVRGRTTALTSHITLFVFVTLTESVLTSTRSSCLFKARSVIDSVYLWK